MVLYRCLRNFRENYCTLCKISVLRSHMSAFLSIALSLSFRYKVVCFPVLSSFVKRALQYPTNNVDALHPFTTTVNGRNIKKLFPSYVQDIYIRLYFYTLRLLRCEGVASTPGKRPLVCILIGNAQNLSDIGSSPFLYLAQNTFKAAK